MSPSWQVVTAECLGYMRGMDAESVDAIVTDPPYFRVKGEAWDRQWEDADRFIEWIGRLADEWQRILKPNGSLYCFASPQMAARVGAEIGQRFVVLNRIRWMKAAGWHNKTRPSDLRSYLSPWEEIIFAEQHGADGSALRGSGWSAACAELHAGVFEPLRQYLMGERDQAGITNREVDEHLGTNGMAGHYFGASQWCLPTESAYEGLRQLFNRDGGKYLRREYEDLRREYEDLRRPFFAVPEAPYTDTWTFDPVTAYAGKHPCEKPVDLMEHIIQISTRPEALVFDPFTGSGSTGVACRNLGRRFLGCERDEHWANEARRRIDVETAQLKLAA